MEREEAAVPPARVFQRQGQKAHVLIELLDRLGVASGDRLLDVGSGPGYASLLAGERVAPDGCIWALDRSGEALAYLRERQAERGLDSIRTLEADAADFSLPDPGINRFLLADTLHHAADPAGIVHHLAQALPPGALGVVSDYDPLVERHVGPRLDVRLPEAGVRAWLEESGFLIREAWRPPDEHYAFLVERP